MDLLFVPLDEVDKIDVLLEDDLWSRMKTAPSNKEIKWPINKWQLTARHP